MDIYVNLVAIYTPDANGAAAGSPDDIKAAIVKAAERALAAATTKLDKDKRAKGQVFGFTTNPKAAFKSAFTLRIKVASMAFSPGGIAVKLTGELLVFPNNEMISTSLKAGGAYEGAPSSAGAIEVIDALAESMTEKTIPVMQAKAAP